jgi:hypothetical protein
MLFHFERIARLIGRPWEHPPLRDVDRQVTFVPGPQVIDSAGSNSPLELGPWSDAVAYHPPAIASQRVACHAWIRQDRKQDFSAMTYRDSKRFRKGEL